MDIEKWFEPIKAGHIMASLFYDSPIDFTLIGTQRRMWSRFSGDTARISPRGNSAVVSCQVSIGLRLALDSFRMLFFFLLDARWECTRESFGRFTSSRAPPSEMFWMETIGGVAQSIPPIAGREIRAEPSDLVAPVFFSSSKSSIEFH